MQRLVIFHSTKNVFWGIFETPWFLILVYIIYHRTTALRMIYVDVQRQGFSLIGSKLPKRQGFENGWTYAHWLEVVNGTSIWIICTAFLLLLSSLMEAVHGGSQPSDGSSSCMV